jgi:valyl-tRNA synthetase
MSDLRELPKAYDASAVEDAIYAAWESSGAFNPDQLPDRNQKGEPFCIMMPPPNRTGTLHMGHAQRMSIQDLMIRFERMRGKRTLWIPGTDHAAIATQVKVEQILIKEGYKDPRKELGREAFLERVIDFADKSRDTIVNQARKMGSSCDWTRERYTFDNERNLAVNTIFGMMFEDGLIERGFRVVNWDPQFQTTLSDDEVDSKEVTARLLTFKYDNDFPIAISSTRPETKFGDAAVAVHPDDARYQKLIGQTFEPEFCGKKLSIKIIADPAVDPAFGTGALGVTPAHSMIDAEIAERHGLTTIQVIDQQGKMMADCGPDFAGLTTIEARAKVEEALSASGLLISAEEVQQALPIAQRGGATVEQLPSKQWFVRVNRKFSLRQDTLGKWKKGDKVTLKELMLAAVESGQITLVPERFDKIYFHWINNLRDWCISRQIWFGHQIPVWYKGDESVFSVESPGSGWERDTDTLDTWFSSGSWTFSALGWPDKKEWDAHRDFHPTAVLETGRDILFFWVARMILMSTYAIGEIPFKHVYLSGLVTDEQGRKMSKSLGNILDPLELIPKYGTDAVRLSLVLGMTPGQDGKLSEQKIEAFRNFTNKLWNISRFILNVIASEADAERGNLGRTLADDWILSRLADVNASVTDKLEKFQFSAAGEELRDFTWSDLADWYLEIAKVEGGKADILKSLLNAILRMWHPFMPFVTEHIWKLMGAEGHLMVAEWPEYVNDSMGRAAEFEKLRLFVTDIRRLRAEQGVDATKKIAFGFVADEDAQGLIGYNLEWIKRLTNTSSIDVMNTMPDNWVVATSGTSTIGFNKADGVDLEAERVKLEKELVQLEAYIKTTDAKLSDAEFSKKAPENVVRNMSDKLEEAKEKAKVIKSRLS